jgi:hypothetical protein
MPIFKKGEDGKDKGKNKKRGVHQTKSGRWITPQQQKELQEKEEKKRKKEDSTVKETLSQIDLDIPGMVVLQSKEDRHLGRLNQDMKAREEYREKTRQIQRSSAGEALDESDVETAEVAEGGLDPSVIEAGEILLQKLLENGFIEPEQKDEILQYSAQQDVTVCEAIIGLGIISPHPLGTFIAGECKIPFSNLDILRVSEKAKGILTREEMVRFRIIPVSKIGNNLNIAAINPIRNTLVDRLKGESGYEVKCIVCTPDTFTNTLNTYYE